MTESKRIRLSEDTNYYDRCTICQKKDYSNLVSGLGGHEKVWLAANEKKNAVYSRLLSLVDRISVK